MSHRGAINARSKVSRSKVVKSADVSHHLEKVNSTFLDSSCLVRFCRLQLEDWDYYHCATRFFCCFRVFLVCIFIVRVLLFFVRLVIVQYTVFSPRRRRFGCSASAPIVSRRTCEIDSQFARRSHSLLCSRNEHSSIAYS